MIRSMSPAVSAPQRLAACALVLAGALCLFATSEGLRLRSAAIEPSDAATPIEQPAPVERPAMSPAMALDSARMNLARAEEAFTRSDADQAAQFALDAQDDLKLARAQPSGRPLADGIAEVEAGLQALRERGLSREQARRGAPPVFDFFRGFRDWGNPDHATDGDDPAAPSAHPLGPAQPLAHGRHIMASLQGEPNVASSRVGSDRA